MLVFDWSLDPLCQMLFFLITCCFSFIFFYNSLSIKPCRLLSLWSLKGFSLFQLIKSIRIAFFRVVSSLLASRMSPRKKNSNSSSNSKVDTFESISEMSVLDLPDLVLETILEKLPPQELCRMASVCTSLREMCVSDHLWENHMKKKWSKIVGPAAYKEWQYQIASGKGPFFSDQGKENGLVGYLTQMWPFVLIRSSLSTSSSKNSNFPPPNSTMAWYFALESGKFWFPAQVYNRENGHVGFMLSCYDAEICYDQKTDTFNARYPPHGRRASPTESGITWDRLRAAPANSSPHDLHVSDCLNELRPGDHIEIQWRRNKEFPYGWWYGVVGHSETCDGNANYCRCHDCDMVVLEFNQYSRGSRWRTTNVFRKHHREEGNEADGFYGGIRKLSSSDEISTWKKIWPSDVLE